MPSWSEILHSIQTKPANEQITYLEQQRSDYLRQLADKTGRNVIAYYSAFLQKSNAPDIAINDKDMNAFMEAVYKLKKENGLDLLLHTPGGDIAATEQIIKYLHSIFKDDIRAIIPQMAMSAGAIISVSCREIIMGKQSCLGPFDPQLNGVPCQSALKEFALAKEDVKENPHALGLWQAILSKYTPTFLLSCQQATKLTDELADAILNRIGDKEKINKIKTIFGDNTQSKIHARHFSKDTCREAGLNIIDLEDDPQMQDLVLSIHHCYMIAFQQTAATKIVENNIGGRYMRIYAPR